LQNEFYSSELEKSNSIMNVFTLLKIDSLMNNFSEVIFKIYANLLL